MNKNKIIITENNPTPLLEDFKTYLTYLSMNKIKLTKASGYFTKKDLLVLYPQMKCDDREVPQKSTQLNYPILHLFYHISIALDLFKVSRTKSTASAIIQTERIDAFMKMTSTEQYLTLLETFWTEVDWKEVQSEKWGKTPSNIDFLFEELESIPANQEIDLSRTENIRSYISGYGQFLSYFHYFGLWDMTIDYEKSNDPDRPIGTYAKSVTLTPLFKKIQHGLYETWNPYRNQETNAGFELFDMLFSFSDEVESEEEVEEEENIEPLSELLRPLFPKEEFTTILKKEPPTFKEGTYLFKVALSSSCWRTVQLSSDHTLLGLHDLIQEAFDFDDDHLYAFYMDGKRFSKLCYNSPMDSSGPYVNKVKIGELDLNEGQSFLYLFDFGDEWAFNVQLVKFIENEVCTELEIIEGKGESPEQYDYDWDEI